VDRAPRLAKLVVITGTGTGIGKTHFAEALLLAIGQVRSRVIGLKPVETGLREATVSDAARLERASSFHVEPFGYMFAESLSPHLAARDENDPIDMESLIPLIGEVRDEADLVLVELPGGLFTPLSDLIFNADFARDLRPDLTLLVAPDRLGALHDVIATTRAARSVPLPIDGIVLVTPEPPDSATGRNGPELRRLLDIPVLDPLPRASVADLAAHDTLRAVVAVLTR
jgi:dethiobiotin synthetase